MFSSWPLAAKTTGTTVKARECHWWWKSKTSKEYDMIFIYQWASLVAQRLKHLPPMQETRVRSLGREDPLEKEMATHSSIIAWRIPRKEELGRLQSTGLQRVGYDWVTSLHFRLPLGNHQLLDSCWLEVFFSFFLSFFFKLQSRFLY